MSEAHRYHHDLTTELTGKYEVVARRLRGLPERARVLEVGCHTGSFARALLARGLDVVGVELDASAAAEARRHGVQVIAADARELPDALRAERPFDRVLFMDVLEHLPSPEQALRAAHPLLAPGGRIVVTGPNVAYWAMRKDLMLGRFEYRDQGILDRTHLRFYTLDGWQRLLVAAGYRVDHLEPIDTFLPLEQHYRDLPLLRAAVPQLRAQLLARLPELFAIHVLLEATPDAVR